MMSKDDIALHRRRVGRMEYEQVRRLFDENRQMRNDHACEQCVMHREVEYARCPEICTLSSMEAWKHRKTCSICQQIIKEWTVLDSCVVLDELQELENMYARRLLVLENR